MNLQKAIEELNQAVKNVGGLDNAVDMCDRMYEAQFRSEPIKINEYFFDQDDIDTFCIESAENLALEIYLKKKQVLNFLKSQKKYFPSLIVIIIIVRWQMMQIMVITMNK